MQKRKILPGQPLPSPQGANQLRVVWSSRISAYRLTKFFVENVGRKYISCGELQCARASTLGEWSKNLGAVVKREMSALLEEQENSSRLPLDRPTRKIALAYEGSLLVGLAIVKLEMGNTPPFAVLEDIVTRSNRRTRGVGTALLSAVEAETARAGCKWMFLESGAHNSLTHKFFISSGYSIAAVMMAKSLEEHHPNPGPPSKEG